MISKTVPNENILKLKELTNTISNSLENDSDREYEKIVRRLKKIIDEGKNDIEMSDTPQIKMQCYESMCHSITTILNSVKH